MQTNTNLTNKASAQPGEKRRRKRSKLKIATLILIMLAILVAIICVLMLWKPSDYESPQAKNNKEVSKYLTHVISKEIYNGAQRGEPFRLILIEEGINHVIIHSKWPRKAESVTIDVPEAIFEPDKIILRGLVNYDSIEILVAVEGNAFVDEQGLLNLMVSKVKIGAVNVTFFARLIAQSVYSDYLKKHDIDAQGWEEKLKRSVIQNEPFDPVFEVDDRWIRMTKVKIEEGTITIDFVPANEKEVSSNEL